MKVIFSSIAVNQTSETAGDPMAIYRYHVSIQIPQGHRHRNGKKLNKFQLLFNVCGGLLAVELKSFL